MVKNLLDMHRRGCMSVQQVETILGRPVSDFKHLMPSPAADTQPPMPVDIQFAETQPADTQPAGTQPAGTQPAGTQPPGTEPPLKRARTGDSEVLG